MHFQRQIGLIGVNLLYLCVVLVCCEFEENVGKIGADVVDHLAHVEVLCKQRLLLFRRDLLQLESQLFELVVLVAEVVAVDFHVAELALEQKVEVLLSELLRIQPAPQDSVAFLNGNEELI